MLTAIPSTDSLTESRAGWAWRGRIDPAVAEQLADDQQLLAEGQRPPSEAVRGSSCGEVRRDGGDKEGEADPGGRCEIALPNADVATRLYFGGGMISRRTFGCVD